MKETKAEMADIIDIIDGLKIAGGNKQYLLDLVQEKKKRKQRGGKDIMQMGYYATQNQGYNSRTARADHRLRMAKRAAAKRQRLVDTVQCVAETVFLVGITGVGILLLGAVIAVLG